MINRNNLKNILVLDIETVPGKPDYQELSDEWKALWENKAKYLVAEDQTPEDIYSRAGIYAEFGKIVCIVVGVYDTSQEELGFRVKSFQNHDERNLLREFFDFLNMKFNQNTLQLCAHNGKEFDFPYMARRGLVHGLELPPVLQLQGKKPWEIPHIDTLQLWKFGDYKNYTSLELLAQLFGIPTPKDDIDGSMVGRVYWEEQDLDRITQYCRKDVITTGKVFLRLNGMAAFEDEGVDIV
jgi:uncharacterized protein YprB with RNaseH-like and TPR domain